MTKIIPSSNGPAQALHHGAASPAGAPGIITPAQALQAPGKVLGMAHLHQHTQYSMLDGAAKLKDLLKWVKEITPESVQPACAITDHGNMHGAVHFYNYATELGVKPLLGCEFYIVAGDHRQTGQDVYHLTLLAQNFEGYRNLCRLNAIAWNEGFSRHPRISHALLEQHAQGVICLSGCVGAEVPQLIKKGALKEARRTFEWYAQTFPGRFFAEIQRHTTLCDANAPAYSEGELGYLQQTVNEVLKAWSDELGIGKVATNDGHYVRREEAGAHDVLLAIQTSSNLNDEKRMRFSCDAFYVKSPEEMQQMLPAEEWGEEIFDNTLRVADMVEEGFLPVGKKRVYQLPEVTSTAVAAEGEPTPPNETEQLVIDSLRGVAARYPELNPETPAGLQVWLSAAQRVWGQLDATQLAEVRARRTAPRKPAEAQNLWRFLATAVDLNVQRAREQGLRLCEHLMVPQEAPEDESYEHMLLRRVEYELGVISKMGFAGYFLIVAEYIGWARDNGIAVGPGRGSGAGSIVAYALEITDLDPIAYTLLFERFLNPDRVSMPDFDVDFDDVRRHEVAQHLVDKYGEDRVALIATFQSMKPRVALKDVARTYGVDFVTMNKITSLIPESQGKVMPLRQAIEEIADLRQIIRGDARLSEVFEVAAQLEGLSKARSTHAAGVVIGREALANLVPLMRDKATGMPVAQYDMKAVEDIGLVKMDLLGLRTLSLISEALRLINARRQREGLAPLDARKLPDGRKEAFELIGRGDTAGVFQLEGSGITSAARMMKPQGIEDVIALGALYRPGPMENIPTYVRRMHGEEQIDYSAFPSIEAQLRPILDVTYGIPVYQEQLMQMASDVAGYSLGEADLLRRAIGKKIAAEMAQQRQIFLEKCDAKGIPQAESGALFDMIQKFADYGFNRCLPGDAVIMDAATGRQVSLQQIVDGEAGPVTVNSYDEATGRIVQRRVIDAFPSGERQVFRLSTRTGHTLEATDNHPFLTPGGWKQLGDLRPGDRVAVARRLERVATSSLEAHELKLLGYAISEGNLKHPSGFYLYGKEQAVVDAMARCIEAFPGSVARVSLRKNGLREIYAKRQNPSTLSGAEAFLHRMGVMGAGAHDKALPSVWSQLPDDQLCTLLGALWTGDGHVSRQAHYATSSPQLAADVHAALALLGIPSRLVSKVFKTASGDFPGYSVKIEGGATGLGRFAQLIGPHLEGGRILQAQALGSVSSGRSRKSSLPLEFLPRVVEIVKSFAAAQGSGHHVLMAGAGLSSGVLRPNSTKRGVNFSTVQQLAELTGSNELRALSSGDITWEPVSEIVPTRVCPTYDLTVEGTHNFVAQGLVVHNSHAAAYGLLSYHTALLKASYPTEFMAALLTVEQGKKEKVAEYVAEARRMGITVLPPDINHSQINFEPNDQGEILFGLSAIDGISQELTQAIREVRDLGADRMDGSHRPAGPFVDLQDLISAMPAMGRKSNVLTALTQAGALDPLGDRSTILHNIERVLEGMRKNTKAGKGLPSLFGFDETKPPLEAPERPLTRLEQLAMERQALGLYISGHPLEEAGSMLEMRSTTLDDVEDYFGRSPSDGRGRVKAVLVGLVAEIRRLQTKLGKPMGKIVISDEFGQTSVVIFPETWARDGAKLVEGQPAVVCVNISQNENEGELTVAAENILTSEMAQALKVPRRVILDVEFPAEMSRAAQREALLALEAPVMAHPGPLAAELRVAIGEELQVIRIKSTVSPEIVEHAPVSCEWITRAQVKADDEWILKNTRPKREFNRQ